MDLLTNISKIASLRLKTLEELSDICGSRHTKRQRVASELPRNRIAAYQKIILLKYDEFSSTFWADKSKFAEIVAFFLDKCDDNAKRSKQELIRPEIMLPATLKFLAGGLKHEESSLSCICRWRRGYCNLNRLISLAQQRGLAQAAGMHVCLA